MQVIYVDGEKKALDNFCLTVKGMAGVESLKLFQSGDGAVAWAEKNAVDMAFLDMEIQGTSGIALAEKLKQLNRNIHIVFVTAYSQFALDAFSVDAIGYILKPYSREDIQRVVDKAKRIKPLPYRKVTIETIPDFTMWVDEEMVHFGKTKSEELLALIVSRGERGITSGEAIGYLWPERADDSKTQALFRMTFKRMMSKLDEMGISDIIVSNGRYKYINRDKVDCDLYRILEGDREISKKYAGEYMCSYSWAEGRNGQLNNMLLVPEK